MSLAIDPSVLTDDDIGEKRATVEIEHEEAIEHARKVFTDVGFGVPVEFSPSDLLNEKVDADRDPLYVLGACNPAMADRALDASDENISALFPCNVIVRQVEPGVQEIYHVSIMKIARLTGMAPDDETWEEIVADTGEMVEEAYSRL